MNDAYYPHAARLKVIWTKPSTPFGLAGRVVGAAEQLGEFGAFLAKLEPPPPAPETQ